MVQILVNDIIPIIVIMALGYVCGKLSYFDDDQRQGLNKVVLNIALPAALFISIVKAHGVAIDRIKHCEAEEADRRGAGD